MLFTDFLIGNKNTLNKLPIVVVLLLAFVLRVIWLILIPVEPVSDSFMYDQFAVSIREGYGYAYPDGSLTAYWPVGTSAIYALIYMVFGHSYMSVVIFNLFISLFTTYLIIALGVRWFDYKVGFFAGIVYACWPSQIQFVTILASELIFNLFFLLGVFFWWHDFRNNKLYFVFSVFFFSLASYVRPVALLIPCILLFLDFCKDNNFLIFFKKAVLSALIMGAVFAPWSIRNYHLFDHFVLISTNGGPVFWMGNNPDSSGEYMSLPKLKFKSEYEREVYFKEKAFLHILEEPNLFLKRCIKRFFDYFKYETIGVHWNKPSIKKVFGERVLFFLKVVSTVYWYLVLFFAIFGGYKIFTNMRGKGIIYTPVFPLIIYFTVIHVIIASGDRYHFPIIPFLSILSGVYLSDWINIIRNRVGA